MLVCAYAGTNAHIPRVCTLTQTRITCLGTHALCPKTFPKLSELFYFTILLWKPYLGLLTTSGSGLAAKNVLLPLGDNFENLDLKIAPHLSRTCVLTRKPSRALRFDHAGLTFSHRLAAVGPTNRTCTGVGSLPRCILVL